MWFSANNDGNPKVSMEVSDRHLLFQFNIIDTHITIGRSYPHLFLDVL